ncbi:MAG: hypothetical protein FJ351_04290 [Sphingomonadales bacterium]|nr:hypothetical protein [Sphingomonadales bacterium]
MPTTAGYNRRLRFLMDTTETTKPHKTQTADPGGIAMAWCAQVLVQGSNRVATRIDCNRL